MGSGNLAKALTSEPSDEVILEVFQEVGQILANARKEKNLTIWQVAAQIHIRQQYLADLEEGRLYDLPGRVYILGFIRTYARLLELDGEELVRRVSDLPNIPDYERSQVPIPMHTEEEPNFPVLIVSAVFIVLVAIGGYFFLKPAANSAPTEEIPPLNVLQPQAQKEKAIQAPFPEVKEPVQTPESLSPAITSSVTPNQLIMKEEVVSEKPALSVKSAQPAQPTQPAQPVKPAQPPLTDKNLKPAAPVSKKIILKAREPSWVEIRDEGGRVFFMRVLQRGEEYVVPDKPGSVFNTGNAGGIDIYVGDQKLPSLGGRGDVKRGVRIDTLQ